MSDRNNPKPIPTLNKQQIEKFWARIIKLGEDDCWLWIGTSDKDGYGRFSMFRDGKGDCKRAHRVSFFIETGIQPEGMVVCHKCDNPPCCNPKHLFLATSEENTQDRENKGRGAVAYGSNHYIAKLTEDQVRQIKEELKTAEFGYMSAKARELGVDRCTIKQIKYGKSWKHVD